VLFYCHFDPKAVVPPGDVKAGLHLHSAPSHPIHEKFHSIYVMVERLVTGLFLWRLGFKPRPVYMGFVTGKGSLGRIFL